MIYSGEKSVFKFCCAAENILKIDRLLILKVQLKPRGLFWSSSSVEVRLVAGLVGDLIVRPQVLSGHWAPEMLRVGIALPIFDLPIS